MNKGKIILTGLAMLTLGCTRYVKTDNSGTSGSAIVEGKLYSSFYMQRAAEYHALCLQAMNCARLRLDNYSFAGSRPKAIVTDIDETVLDNSPYTVHQGFMGKDYESESWYEWTSSASADTIPGVASFLKYASSKGVEIFYITNREERERQSTLKNLQLFGLPNADDSHLLLKTTTSGKEPRRQTVLQKHEIVMLLGDNLSDFAALFDKKTPEERMSGVKNQVAEFGGKFIVLPNPAYGDWEGAMFRYNYKLTPAQKDSVIKASLKGY